MKIVICAIQPRDNGFYLPPWLFFWFHALETEEGREMKERVKKTRGING